MICLTFDTDHMSARRMAEFLGATALPGQATIFCTQPYDCLEDTEHELCPHPQLDPSCDWDEELARTRAEFPLASGWRSHSCVYSHLLAERLAKLGYAYVSIRDEIGRAVPRPFAEAWGVWHLPIYYMDTLDISRSRFWKNRPHTPFAPELIETALDDDGVYVFDFHPVHIMLNSVSADSYLESRDSFVADGRTDELRRPGYGVGDFYAQLCSRMESCGKASVTLSSALDAFTSGPAVVPSLDGDPRFD
jgi:hypothetical protein